MRILLTGASGFIGRSILHHLHPMHEVICVVRDRDQCTDAARKMVWDLSAPTAPALPDKIDAVIHAAQSRQYRDFPGGAMDAFRVNVASTALLADYACRAKARSFCLLSSGSVYEPYRGRLHEGTAVAPSSLNGATKLAAEAVLAPYARSMSVTALRLFFPYGPGQTERLIPDLVARVRNGIPITVAGRGGLTMTPVYVDDVARIVGCAVEQAWSGPVNVASPTPITLRRAVQDIGRFVDRRPKFQRIAGRAARVIPDISRLRALIDVQSLVSWEVGLSMTLAHAHGALNREPASNV